MAEKGFMAWAMPDWGKCGGHTATLGDAFGEAIDALKGAGDSAEIGSEDFTQQWFEFWTDPMLCLTVYCIPCFGMCVNGRTLETVDSTYEKECLNNCVTGMLCLGPCYHASRRTALRKKYNVKGSRGMDCILSCCCSGCLLCQEAQLVGAKEQRTIPFTAVGKQK